MKISVTKVGDEASISNTARPGEEREEEEEEVDDEVDDDDDDDEAFAATEEVCNGKQHAVRVCMCLLCTCQ